LVAQAIITDALYRNPNTYRHVSIGPVAAGFVFNAMLFAMVMTEIYRVAKFHHQRLPLYMKEVLWGGINPLPHFTELRAGEIAEVDYEARIASSFADVLDAQSRDVHGTSTFSTGRAAFETRMMSSRCTKALNAWKIWAI
jgi:hypothetical protein